MQTFTNSRIDLPPLRVDENQSKYDFLAFGGPVSSMRAVEYMHGSSSSSTSTSSTTSLFETNSVGNNLFDTFGKTGIFDERYKDIANPVAYGVDYTVINPEKQLGSERPKFMVYTEKMKSDNLGYQEQWKRVKERSTVSRLDDGECLQGQMMVNNQCFAVSTPKVSCPTGFVFDSESQFCVPLYEKQQGRCMDPNAKMNANGECEVKMM